MATTQPSAPATAKPEVDTRPVDPAGLRYIVTNGSGVSQTIPITNGVEKYNIFLQAGGKPTLPQGFTIDAVYLARNPSIGQTVKK